METKTTGLYRIGIGSKVKPLIQNVGVHTLQIQLNVVKCPVISLTWKTINSKKVRMNPFPPPLALALN